MARTHDSDGLSCTEQMSSLQQAENWNMHVHVQIKMHPIDMSWEWADFLPKH